MDVSPPADTLLCLVSDQRMQNIIPLFQKGLSLKQIVLIASSSAKGKINPRYQVIADHLRTALGGQAACSLWEEPVDPVNFAEVKRVCLNAVDHFGGARNVIINITGGTKPMSIGAYQAGFESETAMIYLDTQTECLYHFCGSEQQVEPFDLAPITVRLVLAAHGKQVDEHWTETKQPLPFERQISEEAYGRRPGSLSEINQLQLDLRILPTETKNKALPSSSNLPDWILKILFECEQCHEEDGQIIFSNKAWEYLNGGWLEQYVILALSKDRRFDDVAGNLQIDNIENELDAACTLSGKLAVVECKSGKVKGKEGTAMLNRLRTLKESLGGTFARSVLVVSQPAEQLTPAFKERAGEYVSRIIGAESLGRIEQVIYEELAQKGR